jgi:uncharacterized membrane protein
MALVVQKTGAAQGNPNPIFYSMAQNQAAGGKAVYHDTTSGNNSVPGATGFTAGAGYDQATGLGSVDAANLVNFWNNNAPPDFTLSATPASQTVESGTSASYTVTIAPLNGYTGTVSFSVSGLPTGATATFTPASVVASGNSTLAIATTAGTTPSGSYSLTVTGTDGVLTHTATVTLVVSDFTISASPSSQSANQGGTANYAVTLTPLNGFSNTVSLSISGLPAGATATFTPASLAGSGTSTLAIATSTSTPSGSYPLTITGTDGVLTHTTPATLIVSSADFSLSVTPSSQTVEGGQSTSYTATIAAFNGYTGTVSFSVSGLPAGATAMFTPASVTTSGSSTLAISTTAGTTPAGNYVLTVTGTDGTLTHTANVDLSVADFTISATPSSQTTVVGSSASYTVTSTALDGFTGTLSFSVTGLPPFATATFTPATVTGSGSSTLSIATTANTPAAVYSLTVTATDGINSHSVPLTLVVDPVGDFSLTVSPTSQTIGQGQNIGYGVTVSSAGGFTAVVSMSVSGLPAGATATLSPSSVQGSGLVSLAITTAANTPAGTYTFTITGTSGPLVHTTTATLIVTAPDFSVTASPASQTILIGQSASYTVTLSALNGYAGTVNFSVSGVPAGATATLTPSSITTSGTATLSVSTTSTTPAGTYPIVITGTDGVRTHSVTVSLEVDAQPTIDFTISAPGAITVKRNSSNPPGTEVVTVTGLNGFTGTVNLSISGLPPLVTGQFGTPSITGSGSTDLTFTVAHDAQQGIYNLTVTGTSGLQVHSIPVTLTVN